jgi:cellulose synthase/poly-beta-1,6-N-acetylglucosamine synthase-like glycosyltransferase
MILSIEVILLIAALGLLIPSAFLFLECCAALWGDRPLDDPNLPLPERTVILVPAHNEATGIKTTLDTLLPQVSAPENIIVIADNCSDDTAAIAKQTGVTVLERQNTQLRGKGYALDYGLQYLAKNPPEIVVSVDGDCSVRENTIDAIARLAKAANRPVQATYLMEQPSNPSSKDIVSALAVRVKNLVRPYGLAQLGLPSLLTGSGMAFPWQVLQKVSLANSKTTDDMQLSVDLTLAGHPPLYCPQGKVTGRLMEQKAATSQRSRWEHGHIEMLLVESPRLLKAAIAQRRFQLIALALEIFIPPLSLLVMLWLAATSTAFLATFIGVPSLPLLILGMAGLCIFVSIIGTWAKFSRAEIPGTALLAMPFYLLWKVPLYLAFLFRPQTRWLKTERDNV